MEPVLPGGDAEHLERLRRQLQQEAAQAPTEIASVEAPAAPRSRKGLWGSLSAGAAVVLSKLKFLLVGLKFLKLGKILTTGLSMLATIWVYTWFFGFKFAFGFVLLIFIHEMGHAAVIRLKGLRAGAPLFIPFFGAAIALKDQPLDARSEAEIAIAGPIAGAFASLCCWAIGAFTGSMLFLALAYTGFFMNLFNLLPVSPLDGGRVVGAISKWFWVVGLAIAIPLAFLWRHPILFAVIFLGSLRAWKTWRESEATASYYDLPFASRMTVAGAYFSLVLALALAAVHLHGILPPEAG